MGEPPVTSRRGASHYPERFWAHTWVRSCLFSRVSGASRNSLWISVPDPSSHCPTWLLLGELLVLQLMASISKSLLLAQSLCAVWSTIYSPKRHHPLSPKTNNETPCLCSCLRSTKKSNSFTCRAQHCGLRNSNKALTPSPCWTSSSAKGTDWGTSLPGFNPSLAMCYLGWPWVNVNLTFLICKLGTVTAPPSRDRWEVRQGITCKVLSADSRKTLHKYELRLLAVIILLFLLCLLFYIHLIKMNCPTFKMVQKITWYCSRTEFLHMEKHHSIKTDLFCWLAPKYSTLILMALDIFSWRDHVCS